MDSRLFVFSLAIAAATASPRVALSASLPHCDTAITERERVDTAAASARTTRTI